MIMFLFAVLCVVRGSLYSEFMKRKALQPVKYPLIKEYNEKLETAFQAFHSLRQLNKVTPMCPPDNAWIGFPIKKNDEIAEGTDSKVFSFGDYVVKTIDLRVPESVEFALVNEKLILRILKGNVPDDIVPELYEMDAQLSGVSDLCSARSLVTRYLGRPVFELAISGLADLILFKNYILSTSATLFRTSPNAATLTQLDSFQVDFPQLSIQ